MEADPTGRAAKQPGAKLDAGKLRPALVLDGFAHALAKLELYLADHRRSVCDE